jgi:ATP-dependent DNA helicase DinG
MHAALKLICLGEDETYVYSAQLSRSKRRIGQESLVAEKIDVGDDLASKWLSEMHSVIFTSATMAIGDSFEHFEHAVGLDRLDPGSHRARQLDSSFDFDEAMSVIVCRDLPAPGVPGYAERLADALYDIHVAMGGSVLTLFTNRREMGRVYDLLHPRLAAAGLELIQQEKGTSPRRLRERFMAEKELSLFALKAFWEGFDATGDTLRCVVIPRLPFSSPTDPLACERGRRDQRAWAHYSLPEAVLEVKQAAGRLIRTATDAGILVMADSRLLSKNYGRVFLNSLPSRNISVLETASIKRYIEMWRRSHRR